MLRRLGDLSRDECEQRVAEGYSAESMLEQARARAPRRAGPDRRARSAGSPPRTRASTATRSASRRRPGCPSPSSSRSHDAMVALVRRYARTHGPFPTGQLAAPLRRRPDARRCASSSAPGSWSAASCSPAAPSASGATPTSCAGCAARASPHLRREVEAVDRARARPLPPRLAERRRPPARRRRPGPPARGAGPAPGRRADARGLGARRAAAPARRLQPGLARRALHRAASWSGSAPGALGRTRQGGALLPRGRAARRPAAVEREARAARGRGPRRDPRAARAAGPCFWLDLVAELDFDRRGAPQRALGPGLGRRGRPTTRSRRCAPRACARSASRAPGPRRFARAAGPPPEAIVRAAGR